MRVYLDNCCFNRPFDDQKQLRIRLEAEAKLGVQETIMEGRIELAWSYILDFENAMNPFEQRKMVIFQWRTHAAVHIHETQGIRKRLKIWFNKASTAKTLFMLHALSHWNVTTFSRQMTI